MLYNNNKIIGISQVKSHNTKIFNYMNNIISGRQLIYHDNQWINIESIINDKCMDKEMILYSLITENNTFYTQNLLLRDFEELMTIVLNRLVENTTNKVF